METDAFFCQLFKEMPGTLFELLGLPAARAKQYRFDSVELKKALRIDGLFVPRRGSLPLYFVEVQFQRMPKFYANLFAKVFCYLEENNPKQEWVAVAIVPSRTEEPRHLQPYEDLLTSNRVRRVYLDELPKVKHAPAGLGLLQLLFATADQAQELAPRVVRSAGAASGDSGLQAKVVELVERVLMCRFPDLGREEVRMKFKLHDIRESKVWKEAYQEGEEKGEARGKLAAQEELISTLLDRGFTHQQVADLIRWPLEQVKRLARAKR